MADTVYFSKIEYCEVIGYGNTTSIMLLNIPEQELSYQVYDWKRQMPAIEGMQTKEINKYTWTYDIALPAKKIRNGKTGFEPQFIRDEEYNPEITFSYAIKLTDDQMQMLLEIPRDYFSKKEKRYEEKRDEQMVSRNVSRCSGIYRNTGK